MSILNKNLLPTVTVTFEFSRVRYSTKGELTYPAPSTNARFEWTPIVDPTFCPDLLDFLNSSMYSKFEVSFPLLAIIAYIYISHIYFIKLLIEDYLI